MGIDKTGEWWKGENFDDLAAYIKEFTRNSYPADKIVACSCECGEACFRITGNPDEGCAMRHCDGCGKATFICDSAEYWDVDEAEDFACPCGNEHFELGIGFAMRSGEDAGEVRWISVGARCLACGVLGVYVDWKVDYSPSAHLINET